MPIFLLFAQEFHREHTAMQVSKSLYGGIKLKMNSKTSFGTQSNGDSKIISLTGANDDSILFQFVLFIRNRRPPPKTILTPFQSGHKNEKNA